MIKHNESFIKRTVLDNINDIDKLTICSISEKYHIGFKKAYRIWRELMEKNKILQSLKSNISISKNDIKLKYNLDEKTADEIYKEYHDLLVKKVLGNYKRNISDKLALGYGSKYQLLRMLGWHREYFNREIANVLDIDEDIKWKDFNFNGSEDKELLNIDFIPTLKKDWEQVWASTSNLGINWDAIGESKDDTFILLEAKAHIKEVGGNTTKSRDPRILNSISKLMKKYNINVPIKNWLENNYQLANRLVFLDFLKEKGYKAKFIYVFFVNGYVFNTNSPKHESLDDWKTTIDNELKEMGIKGSKLEEEVNVLYFDCDVK